MARSFAILEYLAASPGRVVDVTRALGLPWATVHRTIIQLEKAQFLRRDPEDQPLRDRSAALACRLGLSRQSSRPQGGDSPISTSSRTLRGSSSRSPSGSAPSPSPIYSAQRLAEDITKAHYGYHFPLHCGSKGQVLLAYEEPRLHRRVSPPRPRAADQRDDHRPGGAARRARQDPPGRDGADRRRRPALHRLDVGADPRRRRASVVASLCFIFRKVAAPQRQAPRGAAGPAHAHGPLDLDRPRLAAGPGVRRTPSSRPSAPKARGDCQDRGER